MLIVSYRDFLGSGPAAGVMRADHGVSTDTMSVGYRTVRARIAVVNRTQALVLTFFFVVWISLVAILLVEPGIYDNAMKLPDGDHLLADLAFLGAISAFIALLVLGVLRRWTFWLILVAFLIGGLLRVPASILARKLPASGPTWYVLFQAVLGVVQVAIGVLMLARLQARRYVGPSETRRSSM